MSTKKHIAASGKDAGKFVTCTAKNCTLKGGFHSTAKELSQVQQQILSNTGKKKVAASISQEEVLRYRLLSPGDKKRIEQEIADRIANKKTTDRQGYLDREARRAAYWAADKKRNENYQKLVARDKIARKFDIYHSEKTNTWNKEIPNLSAAGSDRKEIEKVFTTLKEGGCEVTYEEDKGFLRTEYKNIKVASPSQEVLVAFSTWVKTISHKSVIPN